MTSRGRAGARLVCSADVGVTTQSNPSTQASKYTQRKRFIKPSSVPSSALSQYFRWIDLRCVPRGEPAGERSDRHQHQEGGSERDWVVRFETIQQCGHEL